VRLRVGTSGYNYPEWKGTFYPKDLPASKMLAYYVERFTTVEINNTFYRMPNPKAVAGWGAAAPAGFTYVLKAPQKITHFSRLRDVDQPLGFFCETAQTLGDKLGPLFFQLPPNFKKATDRLADVLAKLPPALRVAFEFRHESWFDDEVYDAMRERDIAMCIMEQDDFKCPVISTASWGYLRLHKLDYDAAALSQWAKCVTGQTWKDAYVFFKHDEGEGSGPPAVATFVTACGT